MRTCEQCDVELTKSTQKRFCSRACLFESMRRSETRTCPQCGQAFTCAPHQPQRFCSPACYNASQIGHASYLPDPVQERSCVVCGATFLVGGRGRPSKRTRFCSNACKLAGRYRHGAEAHALSPTDAAYIAGLIDGEGSIMLIGRNNSVGVRLTVTNSNQGVLDWLATATGVGAATTHRASTARHAATWYWQCNGDAAASVLSQIRPYMRIKAQQADLAISTRERLRDPALKADRTWQTEWRQRMQDLNRRGPRDTCTLTAGG